MTKLLTTSPRAEILRRIEAERALQDQTFGDDLQDQPDGTRLAILMKKVGDASTALISNHAHRRDLDAELVQVAAVAVAWLESRS